MGTLRVSTRTRSRASENRRNYSKIPVARYLANIKSMTMMQSTHSEDKSSFHNLQPRTALSWTNEKPLGMATPRRKSVIQKRNLAVTKFFIRTRTLKTNSKMDRKGYRRENRTVALGDISTFGGSPKKRASGSTTGNPRSSSKGSWWSST